MFIMGHIGIGIDAEISEYIYCHNKPEDSNKLLVLLEKKSNEVSLDILEDVILNVFRILPRPIYGIVKQKLDAEQVHTDMLL